MLSDTHDSYFETADKDRLKYDLIPPRYCVPNSNTKLIHTSGIFDFSGYQNLRLGQLSLNGQNQLHKKSTKEFFIGCRIEPIFCDRLNPAITWQSLDLLQNTA